MKKTFGQIAYEAARSRALQNGLPRAESIPEWSVAPDTFKDAHEVGAAAVLASQWRSDPKPAEGSYFVAEPTTFWMPIPPPPLPQPPVDPYAELKAAHAAGKVIQEDIGLGDWSDLDDQKPFWNLHHSRYRIKPWEFSRHLPGFRALEPGESYHREDFTEEMLPEGYRPALMNENFDVHGACEFRNESGMFMESSGKTFPSCRHTRTRRPLPPTKQELERKEFEEWWETMDEYNPCMRYAALKAWQAARNQKEAK